MRHASTLIAVAFVGANAIGIAPVGGCASTKTRAADAGDDGGAADGGAACPPGTARADDGTCIAAGVPPAACAAGFVADGDQGCAPILPAAPCAEGQVAWLGETACHDIVDCGEGTWGNIPVDADTVYVDGTSVAGDADGTAARPWPSIGAGVAHAARGAIVAIAAGSYAENVDLGDKPVRLWGRCPRLVQLDPPASPACVGGDFCPLVEASDADGAEIHALAVSFVPRFATAVRTASASIDGVWLRAAQVYAQPGTLLRVHRVLADANDPADLDAVSSNGDLFVDQSVVHGTPGAALFAAANAIIHATVVDGAGQGVAARGTLAVVDSLVRNVAGEAVSSETALIVSGSTIEDVGGPGMLLGGVALTAVRVSTTTIRRTGVRALANGPAIFVNGNGASPVTLDVANVRISNVKEYGVGLQGAVVARLAGVSISTIANDAVDGFGFGIMAVGGAAASPDVVVRDSVIDGAVGAAIYAEDAAMAIDGVVLRGTQPLRNGSFGDGASVVHGSAPTSLHATRSRIEGNVRAGIACFGSSVVVTGDLFDDDGIDLDAEPSGTAQPTLIDGGGNACSTAGAPHACIAQTTGLTPPNPSL